jgi:hypothetical protein
MQPQITPDGSGGAIVTWQDLRNTVTFIDEDNLARRESTRPVWRSGESNGVALCTEDDAAPIRRSFSDGVGGAIVVWTRYAVDRLQPVRATSNAAGAVLWADRWSSRHPGATSGQTGPAPVKRRFWRCHRRMERHPAPEPSTCMPNRITGGGHHRPTAVRDTAVGCQRDSRTEPPQPLQPSTTIEYTVVSRGAVKIHIFDAKGARGGESTRGSARARSLSRPVECATDRGERRVLLSPRGRTRGGIQEDGFWSSRRRPVIAIVETDRGVGAITRTLVARRATPAERATRLRTSLGYRRRRRLIGMPPRTQSGPLYFFRGVLD